jgi:hypothetical protein
MHREGEIRAGAIAHAQNTCVPVDHGVELGGTNINVTDLFYFHDEIQNF